MTDQSRVNAVRDAINRAASEGLTYDQIAQAAIKASDAWMKVRGQELLVEQCINMATQFHAKEPDK